MPPEADCGADGSRLTRAEAAPAASAAWLIRWWRFERELDGHDTTWLTNPGPRSPRGLLIDVALNGTHPTPQLALWRRVDPRGRSRPVYDRYAHVTIVATAGAPRFRLRTLDGFRLELDPCGSAFASLGATHVLLYGGGAEEFAALSGFEHLARIGKSDLFRVDARGCPPDRALDR